MTLALNDLNCEADVVQPVCTSGTVPVERMSILPSREMLVAQAAY